MKYRWSNEFDTTILQAEGIYFIENDLDALFISGLALNRFKG